MGKLGGRSVLDCCPDYRIQCIGRFGITGPENLERLQSWRGHYHEWSSLCLTGPGLHNGFFGREDCSVLGSLLLGDAVDNVALVLGGVPHAGLGAHTGGGTEMSTRIWSHSGEVIRV